MARSPRRGMYRAAQAQARRLAGSLSREAIQNVQRALIKFSDRVASIVAGLPADAAAARAALRTTEHLLARAAVNLERELVKAIADGRLTSFGEVTAAWQDATLARLRQAGLTDQALISLVRDPPVTLLGAYEGLGGAAGTWKTLVGPLVRNAAAEADAIIRAALTEGVSPVELARRLRPYVRGAEPFHRAFGGLDEVNLARLEDATLRHAAGNLLHNANRIAFTEIHNARAEAEVTAFAADPFVQAVARRLAPDRGSQVEPDECDVLAGVDFYGLGEGVYPVDEVPPLSHPWDRCENVPVVRGTAAAGEPKPMPPRQLAARDATIPNGRGLTITERDRILARAEQHLRAATANSAGMASLASTSVGQVTE